jgi:hypothetical protein
MKNKITVQEAMRRAVYPDWMREAASKGGKKSRRKLTSVCEGAALVPGMEREE